MRYVLLIETRKPLLLYNPTSKVLATPNVQAQVFSAEKKARKGQFSALGHQPRLSISVKNFVDLMCRGYSTENLRTLVVWASDDFLPAGVIQSKVSSVRYKKKRRTAVVIDLTTPEPSASEGIVSLIEPNPLAGKEGIIDLTEPEPPAGEGTSLGVIDLTKGV